MKKIILFLMLRTPIYILSIISYYANNDFDMSKYIKNPILNKYFLYILLFTLIVTFLIFCFLLKSKISKSEVIEKKFLSIQKSDNYESQFDFMASYIIPLIAGFQDASFLFLLLYELFIFVLLTRNVNKYYRLLISLIYTEYIGIEDNSEKEVVFFSSEKENIIKKYITHSISDKKIKLKNINFSNSPLSKNILVFKEIK